MHSSPWHSVPSNWDDTIKYQNKQISDLVKYIGVLLPQSFWVVVTVVEVPAITISSFTVERCQTPMLRIWAVRYILQYVLYCIQLITNILRPSPNLSDGWDASDGRWERKVVAWQTSHYFPPLSITTPLDLFSIPRRSLSPPNLATPPSGLKHIIAFEFIHIYPMTFSRSIYISTRVTMQPPTFRYSMSKANSIWRNIFSPHTIFETAYPADVLPNFSSQFFSATNNVILSWRDKINIYRKMALRAGIEVGLNSGPFEMHFPPLQFE